MSTQAEKCATFLALHHGDTPLLMPNAWDPGTAKFDAAKKISEQATIAATVSVTPECLRSHMPASAGSAIAV